MQEVFTFVSPEVLWLVVGLILGAAEILVGTFYLLVAAVACLLAAAAAWAELSAAWQLSAFAAAMIVGGLLVRRLKLAGESAEHEADALQNADVGQRVSVQKWESDGSAFVDYRGAQWRVVTEPGEPGKVGIYEIVRVDGSRLVVRAVNP